MVLKLKVILIIRDNSVNSRSLHPLYGYHREAVHICNPKYAKCINAELNTLIAHGTKFDRILTNVNYNLQE